jgi:hypothetical protein
MDPGRTRREEVSVDPHGGEHGPNGGGGGRVRLGARPRSRPGKAGYVFFSFFLVLFFGLTVAGMEPPRLMVIFT